jgi:TatD DNase family protein
MQKLFDVHTHTQDSQYNGDREVVILRAIEAGVGMVQVGTDLDMSKKAVALAERYHGDVFATVGLHPNDNKKEVFDYNAYKNLALSSDRVVAIGECGLDYFRVKEQAERDNQKEVFKQHIQLSKEVGKPLMIHCRDAFADLIEILRTIDYKLSTSGVVHFFSGSVDDAKKLLDAGFYFSFGGVITFARDYDEQIKFIPLDRILLETDAPYVPPVPYRGKRNEPLYVIEVAKKLAEIKGATFEEVARITTQNAVSFFGLLN